MALIRLSFSVLCALSFASAQSPDAEAIFRKAIAVDIVNMERARAYTMEQFETERTLNAKGEIVSTETKKSELLFVHGDPHYRLVEKNGKPLSENDAKKEEEKLRKLLDTRARETPTQREKRLAESEKERTRRHDILKEVPEIFDLKLLGTERIDGREVYVLDAAPKPGFKARTKNGKFASKMKGRIWIDASEFQLVKVDCETIEPMSFGWVLARLNKGAQIQFEQTRVNDEVWLPRRMRIRYEAKVVMVKNMRGEVEHTLSNYRKFQSDSKIVSVSEKTQ